MKDLNPLIGKLDRTQKELQFHLRAPDTASIGQLNATAVELSKMIREVTEAVQELQQYVKNV